MCIRDRCKELPEDVFVNYVLYDRINSEDITDCRPFFYEQIMGRVAGMSLWEAILEINYWCAEHATYEATDSRKMCIRDSCIRSVRENPTRRLRAAMFP